MHLEVNSMRRGAHAPPTEALRVTILGQISMQEGHDGSGSEKQSPVVVVRGAARRINNQDHDDVDFTDLRLPVHQSRSNQSESSRVDIGLATSVGTMMRQ